jgi:hypothetical protein
MPSIKFAPPVVTAIGLYCSASNDALIKEHDSLDFHVEWLHFAATQFDQLTPGEQLCESIAGWP